MTDTERDDVRKICGRFLAEKLMFLNNEDEKWVLDYLASGQGMIPYQMITNFESFTILRLKTLGDLNRIYNFQDTAIMCEIFEQRSSLLQKLFKFNARKCNSASSLYK